jgi:hypothetical protein
MTSIGAHQNDIIDLVDDQIAVFKTILPTKPN